MTTRQARLSIVATLCLLLSIPCSSFARETNIVDNYPSAARSLRALGMGNAYLTMKGTRTEDMFYNPASLHDLKPRWRFSALGGNLHVNKGLYGTVKDILTLANDLSDSSTESADVTVFQTFFNNHVGQFQSIETTLSLFNMGRKDWGIALLADLRTTISMRIQKIPNFEFRSRSDGILAFGKSQGFLGNDLVVGLMAKGIYRLEIDKLVTTGDIIAGELADAIGFDQWAREMGIGADLGVRYRVPLYSGWDPVVAVTYQDIGKTRFWGSDATDNNQSVNAAVGVHPTLGPIDLSIEVGASQLLENRDFMTRLHAGVEVRLPKVAATQVSLRGGINQGYPTGGLSIDWPIAALDLAFYGEEIGIVSKTKASYKFAAAYSFYF